MIPKEARKKLTDCLGRANFRLLPEDRIAYAYDASKEMCVPSAVGFPVAVEQVSRVLVIANEYKIPIVPRGAGTGLTGGAVPPPGGIVMVMAHFNRIIDIDTENFVAIVEPGVITANFQATVGQQGLYYPPDPASVAVSTLGGNIAENAGGMCALKYGVTKDYVMGLEVVLPSGEVIHTGSKCIKDVVGYDITRLFVGSEGTLGVVTKAILKLIPKPEEKQTLLAIFSDVQDAANAIPAIKLKGVIPATLEYLDEYCIDTVKGKLGFALPAETRALLLIDVDGSQSEINKKLSHLQQVCNSHDALKVIIAADEPDQRKLWLARRSLHGALNERHTGWEEEDVSVPISRIPELIIALEEIRATYSVITASFGHAGDGNIHVSFAVMNDRIPTENIQSARMAILKTVIKLEGRIAAEHGIGLVKRDKIGWNIDQGTLRFMESLKHLLDPHGILNPGKIFPSAIRCVESGLS